MPVFGELFGAAGAAAKRALALLTSGETYYEVYRNIKSHFHGATPAEIRSVISEAKRAQAAVEPNRETGRYRKADIPIIGPTPTEVPLLSGNQQYTARGIASWVDPVTGRTERATVFYRYSRLPGKARIESDLKRQAIHQQRDSLYPEKVNRTFDESTLEVDFVSLTRAY